MDDKQVKKEMEKAKNREVIWIGLSVAIIIRVALQLLGIWNL